jgi:hypothetical protein
MVSTLYKLQYYSLSQDLAWMDDLLKAKCHVCGNKPV